MDFGKLDITVGYRSEDYDQRHRRWGEGAGPNLTAVRVTSVRDTFATNDHTTQSFGATYEVNEKLTLVAGFHEGMTPMFGADPEEADNTELGKLFIYLISSSKTLSCMIVFSKGISIVSWACSNQC